jgi:predicted type IV restriction endonuclease
LKGEDDSCQCAPPKPKNKDIIKIKEMQEKRIREAKEAVIKARETRIKMHTALKEAETIRKSEEEKTEKIIRIAKETATMAARASIKASRKEVRATYSVKGKTTERDE